MKRLITLCIMILTLVYGLYGCGTVENKENKNDLQEDDYINILNNINSKVYDNIKLEAKIEYIDKASECDIITGFTYEEIKDNTVKLYIETYDDSLYIESNNKRSLVSTDGICYKQVQDDEKLIIYLINDLIPNKNDLNTVLNKEYKTYEFVEEKQINDNTYGIVEITVPYKDSNGMYYFKTTDGNIVKLNENSIDTYNYKDEQGNDKKLTLEDEVINTYKIYINEDSGYIDIIEGLNNAMNYKCYINLSRIDSIESTEKIIEMPIIDCNEALSIILESL